MTTQRLLFVLVLCVYVIHNNFVNKTHTNRRRKKKFKALLTDVGLRFVLKPDDDGGGGRGGLSRTNDNSFLRILLKPVDDFLKVQRHPLDIGFSSFDRLCHGS